MESKQRRRFLMGMVGAVPLALFYSRLDSQSKAKEIEKEYQRLLPELESIAKGTNAPFRFPMDTQSLLQDFAAYNKAPRFPNRYHAAVDYYAAPGTPVYAIGDGVVSYSKEMQGYGGLVIIDHPEDGVYSLYGHISLTRWMIEPGEVKNGQLIGYIADTNEAWGIGSFPHLHFSIRLGMKDDYPSWGKGNWMAGYTGSHPLLHRYLDPETFINMTKKYHTV
ncbi:M23 family metallopeptidase [Vibrio sonorensis]|uniref:M23 family metallopeptidase n=1 Tax=Vibrio sonorensis TaxID=1004316 RepID=UPI0008DA0508|nr:M23 family metallopeptidase [Vibrio sonorensis]